MTSLSKEEYLKRYLSGNATSSGDSKQKKKKKKTKEKVGKIQPRMRIIDNDADVPSAAVPSSGRTVKVRCRDKLSTGSMNSSGSGFQLGFGS